MTENSNQRITIPLRSRPTSRWTLAVAFPPCSSPVSTRAPLSRADGLQPPAVQHNRRPRGAPSAGQPCEDAGTRPPRQPAPVVTNRRLWREAHRGARHHRRQTCRPPPHRLDGLDCPAPAQAQRLPLSRLHRPLPRFALDRRMTGQPAQGGRIRTLKYSSVRGAARRSSCLSSLAPPSQLPPCDATPPPQVLLEPPCCLPHVSLASGPALPGRCTSLGGRPSCRAHPDRLSPPPRAPPARRRRPRRPRRPPTRAVARRHGCRGGGGRPRARAGWGGLFARPWPPAPRARPPAAAPAPPATPRPASSGLRVLPRATHGGCAARCGRDSFGRGARTRAHAARTGKCGVCGRCTLATDR